MRSRGMGLLVIALVAVAGGLLLLPAGDSTEPTTHPEVEDPAAERRAGPVAAVPPTAPRAPAPAEAEEVVAAAPAAPVGLAFAESADWYAVDPRDDDLKAEDAYRERLQKNIDSLEEAASVAEAEGNPQRAELMRRRIEELERRADEFEADLASP